MYMLITPNKLEYFLFLFISLNWLTNFILLTWNDILYRCELGVAWIRLHCFLTVTNSRAWVVSEANTVCGLLSWIRSDPNSWHEDER